jgi:hypothetical protein
MVKLLHDLTLHVIQGIYEIVLEKPLRENNTN